MDYTEWRKLNDKLRRIKDVLYKAPFAVLSPEERVELEREADQISAQLYNFSDPSAQVCKSALR